MTNRQLKPSAPRSYVVTQYMEYQKKYTVSMRESDKVLIELIYETIQKYIQRGKQMTLLDIGCHNGNLLRHLKKRLPLLKLYGGDLFPEIIMHNQREKELEGIHFAVMDIRALSQEQQFDIVVESAVMGRFSDDEFLMAIESISRVLVPGGWFFAFDWYHPFEQNLSIIEKSHEHPEGLTLNFRSYSQVTKMLSQYGFSKIEFFPFKITLDLPPPDNPNDIRTYTVRTETGERLNFRGALYQPWCHMRACKMVST